MAEATLDRQRLGPSRRTFVYVLFAGAGVNLIAAGTLDDYWTDRGRFGRLILACLRRHLHGLGFSEPDYQRFVRDKCRRHTMDEKEYGFSFVWPVYAWTSLLDRRPELAAQIENWEEKLITEFLLSTDFFDSARCGTPRYVAYYEAGTHPCRNPFARLRDPHERAT